MHMLKVLKPCSQFAQNIPSRALSGRGGPSTPRQSWALQVLQTLCRGHRTRGFAGFSQQESNSGEKVGHFENPMAQLGWRGSPSWPRWKGRWWGWAARLCPTFVMVCSLIVCFLLHCEPLGTGLWCLHCSVWHLALRRHVSSLIRWTSLVSQMVSTRVLCDPFLTCWLWHAAAYVTSHL